MSQFIAQMFQAGALTECAAALLSFRYPSFTGRAEQNITTEIHAKGDDGIRRQILENFVAQCTLVKSGAVQSG